MEYRIALISVTDGRTLGDIYSSVEHLGLAYLAASLRLGGYVVKIVDAYALQMSIEEVIDETVAFRPHLVGCTAEYNTFVHTIDYCERVKRILGAGVTCCMGGEHATYSSQQILTDHACIDFIVRGEGDVTIVAAADRLSRGESLDGVQGVYFRNEAGGITRNPDRPRVADLDSLPFPARDTLEEAIRRGLQPAFSVLTSRGCQFNCSFCNANKFFNIGGGQPWRSRTGTNVAAEISDLYRRYGSEDIYPVLYFLDENFIGPGRYGIQRAHDLADAILDAGLKLSFEIFCRADSFNNAEDAVVHLKKAGLTSALVGLESGLQNSLDVISKHTTVEENLSTLRLFRKHNVITSSSGFIMFNPYSEPAELIKNADFLLNIGHATLYNMSLRVHLYPGIKLSERMRGDGLLQPNFTHWRVDQYRFVNPVVGRIAEAIDGVDHVLVREEDAALRHIDMVLARIKDVLTERGQRAGNGELQAFEAALAPTMRAKLALNRTSYGFFVKTVEQAMEGWSDAAFEHLKRDYLIERRVRLDELNEQFQHFLDAAPELVLDPAPQPA